MTRPLPTGTDHDRHDRTLIAASLAGDLPSAARAAADELLTSCTECAALAVDLRAIATATRALPTMRAPSGRTFTLTATDAARLRRRSWLAGLLRPFGPGGLVPARPIGLALSTLGLVGLLVSASPAGLPFLGAGGAPTYERATVTDASGGPKAQPSPVPGAEDDGTGALSPDGQSNGQAGGQPGAGEDPDLAPAPPAEDREAGSVVALVPPLAFVSIVLLVGGVGLLGVRALARRLS